MQALDLKQSPEQNFDSLTAAHTDVVGGQAVDITVDRDNGRIWVNVNGVCLLRITACEFITVNEV